MRKIQTRDIFSACRIITDSGIKERLIEVIGNAKKDKTDIERVGIIGILETIGVFSDEKCERAFYQWLAPVAEMSEKEVETADIGKLTEVLQSLSAENDLKSFVSALFRLLQSR